MTEVEWNACTDPTPMLEYLRDMTGDRKMRLFAVSCCRRLSHLPCSEGSKNGVEAAEQFADAAISSRELDSAWKRAIIAMEDAAGDTESGEYGYTKWHYACAALRCMITPLPSEIAAEAADQCREALAHFSIATEIITRERKLQSLLLRDIFGSPFRLAFSDPSWLAWNDSTVPKLAQSIYDDRAFDRLPLLADALEEAGCDNQEILDHCRSAGEHVRGCWVVDLLLGKS